MSTTSIAFSKYHGAGNDFVLIDDRSGAFEPFEKQAIIAELCGRQLGIGADGLMLLRLSVSEQLRMIYYNSDGAPSSFCGNGSRCFLKFAVALGIIEQDQEVRFEANDGAHTGRVASAGVTVSMRISDEISRRSEDVDIVETGSPHYVKWCPVLPEGEIIKEAREVRYSEAFAKTGINVNFVVDAQNTLLIRTYERGVEGETLACGTGVTAAALSFAERRKLTGQQRIAVRALGGDLSVHFKRAESGQVTDVFLTGPAVHVFSGTYELDQPAPA